MSPLRELRSRINELCPDRLELTIGCQIDTGSCVYTLYADDGYGKLSFSDGESGTVHGSLANFVTGSTKILGKELDVADVLRAIGKTKNLATVKEDGSLIIPVFDSITGESYKKVVLDLSKPISHQSEEVLAGLVRLLE